MRVLLFISETRPLPLINGRHLLACQIFAVALGWGVESRKWVTPFSSGVMPSIPFVLPVCARLSSHHTLMFICLCYTVGHFTVSCDRRGISKESYQWQIRLMAVMGLWLMRWLPQVANGCIANINYQGIGLVCKLRKYRISCFCHSRSHCIYTLCLADSHRHKYVQLFK